jgi:DNA-binding NtrC family response regulator
MDLFSEIRGMKILLIDDDEWIRDSLRIFFETEGCHVLVFETAEEGLSAIKDQIFDLIIVDYKLPGLDGIEFLKRICGAQPNAIKILITAYRSENVVSEAKKLKIQGFIEKPFTSETVMASLAYTIKMRDMNPQRKFSEQD